MGYFEWPEGGLVIMAGDRRWWLDGNFPEPVKLNGTTLAWHADTINEWIQRKVKISETKSNTTNAITDRDNGPKL